MTKRKNEKQADEPSEVKRMNLNVEVSLHNAFKSATSAAGTNMTDVLLEFIKQYVEEHGVQPIVKKGRRQ